jgi:hypothetical protein
MRIHVEQEPDRVEDAGSAVVRTFSRDEPDRVLASVEEMWRLCTGFFDRLDCGRRTMQYERDEAQL